MTFTIDKVNPGVLPAEVALWKAIPILSDLMNDANFLPLLEEATLAVSRDVPALLERLYDRTAPA
jgi:hypothetical protein